MDFDHRAGHHAWAWRQKEISSSDSNNRPVDTDQLCVDW
ncbi:hypothetical protein NY08_2611 [Rhodococcus sp. B7740]|nr:hypothetical protein NY08_2611 [Rhodococcus sp. B7740]